MNEQEAERIIRHLNGETTPSENLEMEQWLQEAANQETYDHLRKIWQSSASLYDQYEPDLEQALDHIHTGMGAKSLSRTLWRPITKIAAVLLLGIGLFWALQRQEPAQDASSAITYRTFRTSDQKDSILLSDGTMIWLNANSSIQYPDEFAANERKITLQGEAFFQVAHNPHKPFLVHTNRTLTQVLGTSFNIRTTEQTESIVVFTGKVAFSKETQPKEVTYLTKNMQANFDLEKRIIEKSTASDPNVLAWKTGVLIFDNQPLAEVIGTLREHYQVDIALDQLSKADQLRMTATFDNQKPEEILQVIAMTLGLQYAQTNTGYTLKK